MSEDRSAQDREPTSFYRVGAFKFSAVNLPSIVPEQTNLPFNTFCTVRLDSENSPQHDNPEVKSIVCMLQNLRESLASKFNYTAAELNQSGKKSNSFGLNEGINLQDGHVDLLILNEKSLTLPEIRNHLAESIQELEY